jgi:hypothetical protein
MVPAPSPDRIVVSVAVGSSADATPAVTSASPVIVKLHVLKAQAAAGPVPAENRPGPLPGPVAEVVAASLTVAPVLT